MKPIRASARYSRAIAATADLLSRLRVDFLFVGNVARSAWLGSRVESGSIDVLALVGPEQKGQVAMMASNRGYRVDRDEVEATDELDLVPLNFSDADGEVRVHVLVASNALYGRMVPTGVAASLDDSSQLKVPAAEDLALLLAVADDAGSQRDREMLIRLPEFDRRAYNRRLVSIGLPHLVIAE